MKCRDCLREVNEKHRDGLCSFCMARKRRAAYMNKEYIPIKDDFGTNGYTAFVNKYGPFPTEKKEEPKITYKSAEDNKEEIYGLVAKDVDKAFEEVHLSKEYLDLDIEMFIEMFFGFLQEDSYLIDIERAEKTFNSISSDYLHIIENAEWNSTEAQKYMKYEKALLEIRRPTKNKVAEFEIIKPIVEYLKANNEFMELLETQREHFIKYKGTDKTYKLKKTSLADDLDYEKKWKKYRVSVDCFGLYGNPGAEEFWRNITAKNEEDAKAKFIYFIDNNFDVRYKEKDVRVEVVENDDSTN